MGGISMKVERIARDKVRIFISYDDLEERGIDRNEIWQNGRKVQELFWDMMETAYVEVGFEIAGPIAVEAFTMPAEGVVVIVTRIPSIPGTRDDDDDLDSDDDFADAYDSPLLFQFADFENLIQVAHAMAGYSLESTLFRYMDTYYLSIGDQLENEAYQSVCSVLEEYGESTLVTVAVLEEYGVQIIKDNAIQVLMEQFAP
jgi:adapter protein MecA 1/2